MDAFLRQQISCLSYTAIIMYDDGPVKKCTNSVFADKDSSY